MSKGFSSPQLTFRLWALVLLGLLGSAAIAGYVSWSLVELDDEKSASRALYQHQQLNLEQLRRLSSESLRYIQARLLSEGSGISAPPPPIGALERAIAALTQDASNSIQITAFTRRTLELESLWTRTQDWQQAFAPVERDLRQGLSLGKTRQSLQRLRTSIESLEGQHNLFNARLLRRWRSAQGAAFSAISEQVMQQEGMLWPRALGAAKIETTELALLTERLSIQQQASELADLKDNQFKPAIDRLIRQLGILERRPQAVYPDTRPDIIPVLKTLFGSDYRTDPAHQTIVVGSSGLFRQQLSYLALNQTRQQLLLQLNSLTLDNERDLQSIMLLADAQRAAGNQQAETRLADALIHIAGSVAALALLFLLLGILLSRHIRQQFIQLAELQGENELILNSASEGVIGLDTNAEMRFVNPAASRMLGATPELMTGQSLLRYWNVAEDPLEQPSEFGERIIDQRCRLIRADGSQLAIEYSVMPMRRQQRLEGAVLTFRDVSAADAIQRALLESEQKFRDLSEKSLVGVYIIQGGLFCYVNPHFAEVFGYRRDEIEFHLGPQHIAHPDDLMLMLHNIDKRLSGEVDSIAYSVRGLRKGGAVIHLDLLGSRTQYQGQPAVIGTLVDTTKRTQAEAQIRHQAYHDPLTGLPNRLLANDRLEHALQSADRLQQRVAVLFLDLDRFKHINDSLGHPVGDAVLVTIAGRLNNIIRQADTVARLGGDEFMVIMESLEAPQAAADIARKIQVRLAQPVEVAGHELFIGTSIGISLYPDDGSDAQTLIKNADAAMYQAKRKGRATFAFYTEALTLTSTAWLNLEAALRQALPRHELYLEYQPQINLSSGQLTGAEALLRWNHPQKGLISPDKFIPLAEETGLILKIGDWVLDQACQQIQRWQQQGYRPPVVAVNVSSIQISRGDILASVDRALSKYGVDACYLELEITENCLMENTLKSSDILLKLRERGISLAIDDFGTGYSSLAYLKQLPINKLKIDRSFITDIPANHSDAAITKAIIMLGQLLDLEVIAEGIETLEQQHFLHLNGCHSAQGFLFSRSVSAEVLATQLATSPHKAIL